MLALNIVNAFANPRKSCGSVSTVQEALDVWSLGVMAFELLTGKAALLMHEGKDKVLFQHYIV